VTHLDRALPRRKATLRAEHPQRSAPRPLAIDELFVELPARVAPELPAYAAPELPTGAPRSRRGAFRGVLAVAFLGAAVGGGFVAGGGLAAPAARETAAPATVAAAAEPVAPTTSEPLAVVAPSLSLALNPFSSSSSEPPAETSTTAAPTTTAPKVAPTTAAPKVAPTTTQAPRLASVAPTTKAPATTVTTAAPLATPPPTTAAPATTAPIARDDAATLACIRQRESGGNYSVVSSNGLYYGAYQFSLSTWDGTARHAGRGDLVGVKPNVAAPADQDAMALHLLHWQGLAPWGGYCG
jgi:hypothetical protein